MVAIILILGIAVFYVIEVGLGSDLGQYDGELGRPSHLKEPKPLPREEFGGRLLPLALAGLGSAVMLTAPQWGLPALSAALILYLYVGTKVWKSVTSL